ncbi:MAG: hypothetical protein A3J48_03460 [Candidatus Doudnabacteria bacterium RIFCSPHIGHO2_02_FULL_46_11]|uniref:Uncharacterized protein n=1 Tax=Candidatus Doudnabacteria bacterium RIFCSPHIGHO2_02_FULL_46_11 TaxID=1817832 RepID=A0A1F5P4N6_9BACT|nr:MAG: hypothetical protein A3J48_03460 [Candidatus Doudnabacteria bacterium RIFCSPHIGHO2_02_FULL_46_11]
MNQNSEEDFGGARRCDFRSHRRLPKYTTSSAYAKASADYEAQALSLVFLGRSLLFFARATERWYF